MNVNTQIATQEESKNIKEFAETTREGMDRIESVVREEAQGIKEGLKSSGGKLNTQFIVRYYTVVKPNESTRLVSTRERSVGF